MGAHNQEHFYETLESTGFKLDDLLIGKPIEHPTIKGIYQQKYRVPAYDGRNNFIGYKIIDNPKTIYAPNIISNEQMLQWAKEAMQNGNMVNNI